MQADFFYIRIMIREFTDQLSRKVSISFPPKRIVSLVPSQTELLFDLGLEKEVVGITKFCIHPQEWFQQKTKIGGTKKFWFDVIDQLQPDLIIGNKEENYQEGIEQLMQQYPVWMSDITDLASAITMIESVAEITDRKEKGVEIVHTIQDAFKQLPKFKPYRVVYVIWSQPWMLAGKGTFIDAMLSHLGMQNLIEETRYPSYSQKEFEQLHPEVVMLSSEPYPFKAEHTDVIQKIFPAAKILLVDGEPFSWYGSRMQRAPSYFATLPLLQ